jgi:hypothetical protein
MSTDYTGDPTATQAPAAAPAVNQSLIVRLPVDGESATSASIYQAHKSAADYITWLMKEVADLRNSKVRDEFTGSAVGTETWNTITGAPTLPDESANGGFGTVKLDGAVNQQIKSSPLAMGTSDFRWKARMRTTTVNGTSSIICGVVAGVNSLAFYCDGAVSTTNWRIHLNGVSTAANGTPVTFSATYADFVIEKIGTTVTFKVNTTLLHTQAAYASSLTGAMCHLTSTAGTGVQWIDSVNLAVF